jgi:hypothetical protein
MPYSTTPESVAFSLLSFSVCRPLMHGFVLGQQPRPKKIYCAMPSSLCAQRAARKALANSALATPDVAPVFASAMPAKALKKRKRLRPRYHGGGFYFLTRKDGPARCYHSGCTGCTAQLLTRTGAVSFGLCMQCCVMLFGLYSAAIALMRTSTVLFGLRRVVLFGLHSTTQCQAQPLQ